MGEARYGRYAKELSLKTEERKSLKNIKARNGKRPPPAKHYDPYGKNPRSDEPGDSQRNGIKETSIDKRLDGGKDDSPPPPALYSPLSTEAIEGRNAVLEAIRAGVTLDKVFIAKGETDAALRHIASTARSAGTVVVDVDRRKLETMSVTHSHQGVIAIAAAAEYSTVGDILDNARKKGEKPFVIICESISDPHNLGAIIRTCESAGAHGVIIPKRRSAGLGATVAKASSGALYHIPVARVSNLTSTIKELKKAGLWIFGASASGETPLWQADLTESAAMVIGSEGSGISRLVNESCDFHVSIPMYGKITSLNASVSAAILMYETVRQRRAQSVT